MRRTIRKPDDGLRWLGAMPLFDPETGGTVIEPPGAGKGWWAGAPSAIFDPDHGGFLLYYRVRKPRELGRGGECRIAASGDGLRFKTIWSATKEQFGSDSIERSALVKPPHGPRRTPPGRSVTWTPCRWETRCSFTTNTPAPTVRTSFG